MMSESKQNFSNETSDEEKSITGLYRNLIINPLNHLDSGNFIHKGIVYIFKILSILIGLYLVYLLFSEMLGDKSYFKVIGEYDGFLMFRSIVVFILTFVVSTLSIIFMFSIIWKRTNDLGAFQFDGIIPFYFLKLLTWKIRTTGEILSILPITIGIINFFTFLFLGTPYSPLTQLMIQIPSIPSFIMSNMGLQYDSILYVTRFSDYLSSLAQNGLLPLVISFFTSFAIIFIFYMFAELYLIILNFILNFSIPIKFRNALKTEKIN